MSSKIIPPKKIQNTAPQEKDKESLGPQVSHGLKGGDPSYISCNPDPFKGKPKGIKSKNGICVGSQGRYGLKGGNPLGKLYITTTQPKINQIKSTKTG